jgi:hypothetical protein
MSTHSRRFSYLAIACLIAFSLLACSSSSIPFLSEPTATRKPTSTRAPSATPAPTQTPAPTVTFTLAPTNEPPQAPAPTEPPLPTDAPAASEADAIKVYYFNKNEKGPYGCNEALYWVKTHQAKSNDILGDVRYALSLILNYHKENFGKLYNPGYASNLSVSEVRKLSDTSILVALTGTYERTKDRCDGPRLRDQLRQTIKLVSGMKDIQITINGTPIADVIARK